MDRLWMLFATVIVAVVATVNLSASASRHESSADSTFTQPDTRPVAVFNPALVLLEARALDEARLVGGMGVPHRYIELAFGDSTSILLRVRLDFWTNSSVVLEPEQAVIARAYTHRAYHGLTLGSVLALVEIEQKRAVDTPYHVLHNNCRVFVERFMNALVAAETSAAVVTPSSAGSK